MDPPTRSCDGIPRRAPPARRNEGYCSLSETRVWSAVRSILERRPRHAKSGSTSAPAMHGSLRPSTRCVRIAGGAPVQAGVPAPACSDTFCPAGARLGEENRDPPANTFRCCRCNGRALRLSSARPPAAAPYAAPRYTPDPALHYPVCGWRGQPRPAADQLNAAGAGPVGGRPAQPRPTRAQSA